ncbi:E3 ubiquitin-protein ligase RNF181 homolog [Linum grandiflorum]
MAAVTASTSEPTATPNALDQYQDYAIALSLLQTHRPVPKSSDQPDSDRSTIVIDAKFERFFLSCNSRRGDPPPSEISTVTPPKQLRDKYHSETLRIPADRESMLNVLSTVNIPLRLEKNIFWRNGTEWDQIPCRREGLLIRIAGTLLQLVAKLEKQDENGKRSAIVLRVSLKIEERVRVPDEEYKEMWRVRGREIMMMESLEKTLIKYQERLKKKIVVEDLKRVLMLLMERHYPGTVLENATADSIVARAYEAWNDIVFSKFKFGLHTVVNKEEDECSICLAPKCDEGVLRFSKCLHSFHQSCLFLWFKAKALTCPLCRYSLV